MILPARALAHPDPRPAEGAETSEEAGVSGLEAGRFREDRGISWGFTRETWNFDGIYR